MAHEEKGAGHQQEVEAERQRVRCFPIENDPQQGPRGRAGQRREGQPPPGLVADYRQAGDLDDQQIAEERPGRELGRGDQRGGEEGADEAQKGHKPALEQ